MKPWLQLTWSPSGNLANGITRSEDFYLPLAPNYCLTVPYVELFVREDEGFVNDTVEDDAGGVGIGGAEAEDGKRGERLLEHVCSPYEWGMRKCTAWSIQCIRFQDAFAQLRAAVTNV